MCPWYDCRAYGNSMLIVLLILEYIKFLPCLVDSAKCLGLQRVCRTTLQLCNLHVVNYIDSYTGSYLVAVQMTCEYQHNNLNAVYVGKVLSHTISFTVYTVWLYGTVCCCGVLCRRWYRMHKHCSLIHWWMQSCRKLASSPLTELLWSHVAFHIYIVF